ncbi:MAG TPA: FMN-binding negative transcriptional regulator [Steroidobacteraceae bacterium]|nr:FMN-binding negative transcriptional regulator [Steroidobacteraceae bacterium]
MYVPKQHEETDLATLHALIRSRPLGTWAMQGAGEIIVNHLPFVLDAARGPFGTLQCHVARASGVWQQICAASASAVVFQGPDSYVSPSWYPGKHLHGKAVPTWNYAVVHAHGIPVVIDEKAWLLEHVNRLTDIHESGRALPWKVADAPTEYIDRMIGQVVGIEIPIASIIGKWKTSQNRSQADRLGVVAGLHAQGDPRSVEMADLVERVARKT